MHLALKPGSDVPLFQGLFNYLDRHGFSDSDFISAHTENYESALRAAIEYSVEYTSQLTELSPQQLEAFYSLFAQTPKTVTIYSQGVNQAVDGTDKVNTIINC